MQTIWTVPSVDSSLSRSCSCWRRFLLASGSARDDRETVDEFAEQTEAVTATRQRPPRLNASSPASIGWRATCRNNPVQALDPAGVDLLQPQPCIGRPRLDIVLVIRPAGQSGQAAGARRRRRCGWAS